MVHDGKERSHFFYPLIQSHCCESKDLEGFDKKQYIKYNYIKYENK